MRVISGHYWSFLILQISILLRLAWAAIARLKFLLARFRSNGPEGSIPTVPSTETLRSGRPDGPRLLWATSNPVVYGNKGCSWPIWFVSWFSAPILPVSKQGPVLNNTFAFNSELKALKLSQLRLIFSISCLDFTNSVRWKSLLQIFLTQKLKI